MSAPTDFRLVNLHPIRWAREHAEDGSTCTGVVFEVEPIEHLGAAAVAFVVKLTETTRGWDPNSQRNVDVPANYAMRVVHTPSMDRLRGIVANDDGTIPRDPAPLLRFVCKHVPYGPPLVLVYLASTGVPLATFTRPDAFEIPAQVPNGAAAAAVPVAEASPA